MCFNNEILPEKKLKNSFFSKVCGIQKQFSKMLLNFTKHYIFFVVVPVCESNTKHRVIYIYSLFFHNLFIYNQLSVKLKFRNLSKVSLSIPCVSIWDTDVTISLLVIAFHVICLKTCIWILACLYPATNYISFGLIIRVAFEMHRSTKRTLMNFNH